MDTVKMRIPATVALAAAQGLGLSALLAGCAGQVPARHAPAEALVRTGELDTSAYDGRRDELLGRNRSPVVRSVTGSTEYTYDRQRVIDGRPYADYRVTTRTRSALER